MIIKKSVQKTQLQLNVLSDWLKNYNGSSYDPRTEGVVETMVRRGVDQALNQIGDYIQEILEMDEEQLFNEVEWDKLELKK